MGTHRYRITVAGGTGRATRQAFEDFTIEASSTHTSLIVGLDQAAALYGALNRIRSLGLELVELTRVSAKQATYVSRRPARGPP
ncbi:MAG: hypothetical protein ACRDOD_07105 [Streptosporangiaceae bacterium]